jgi:hypothetical protein
MVLLVVAVTITITIAVTGLLRDSIEDNTNFSPTYSDDIQCANYMNDRIRSMVI